jgi:DNA polymerase-3 subunit chi
MRVDFYQLKRDPVETALPLIARASLKAGERLLVVSADPRQLGLIGEALWQNLPETFLAHSHANAPHAERQPILLSDRTEAANGARYLAIADGQWRDAPQPFERTFYFFDDAALQAARGCWRDLGTREGVERRFWKQEGGRWLEGP